PNPPPDGALSWDNTIPGAGIFKTTNGGTTWQRLDATANSSFRYVGRLAIDPSNPQRIYAATNATVLPTQDGGATWSNVLNGSAKLQVLVHPANPAIVVAAGKGTAFLSTSYGDVGTWNGIIGGPQQLPSVGGRYEFAGQTNGALWCSVNVN